jgi:protein SCO1
MSRYSPFTSVILLLAGLTALPAPAGAQAPNYSRYVKSYDPPAVTLVDSAGRAAPLTSVLNGSGPVLLQFIFTSCTTICPVMSSTFSAAQDRLRAASPRLRMVSISIDPEHDTPTLLAEYAKRFKAGPQWLFLTGSAKDIAALQRAFETDQGSKMSHLPLTFLRSAPGDPWVRLDGLMSASDLVAEYHRLIGH